MKIKTIPFVLLFVFILILGSIETGAQTHPPPTPPPSPPPYTTPPDIPKLSLTPSHLYYLRGETAQILVRSNSTTTVTLEIWNPNDVLLKSQQVTTDTNGRYLWNVTVPSNAIYGVYTVKGYVGEAKCETWITVVENENWITPTFPWTKTHKGVTYTIYANKTFHAKSSSGELSFSIPELPDAVDVSASANSMAFKATFSFAVKGQTATINWYFVFIHQGCKMVFSGSLPEPSTFSFDFYSPKEIKKYLNSLSSGFLVFDWSDLSKAEEHFSYNHETHKLTVDIPKQFRLDPTIFESGFESGSFEGDGWTGTYTATGETITVVSTDPHHGTYHARAYRDGSSADEAAYVYKEITATNLVYARAYFKFNNLPANDGDMKLYMELSTGTWEYSELFGVVNRGGFMRWCLDIYENGVETYLEADDGPTTGVWYSVELKRDVAGDTQELWVDGVSKASATVAITESTTRVWVGFGWDNYAAEESLFIDCVKVSTVYIGPEATAPTNLLPFEDGFESGDTSAWSGSYYSSTPPTVVSDYVYDGTYSCKCVAANGDSRLYKVIAPTQLVRFGGWFRFDDLPNANGESLFLLKLVGSDVLSEVFIYFTSDALSLWMDCWRDGEFHWDDVGTQVSLSTNTWYHFELETYVSTSGWHKAYLSNELMLTSTGDTTGRGYIQFLSAGIVWAGNEGFTLRFDSVKVSSIINMDDVDNLYAQKKWYYGVSAHKDINGYTDIDYCEFRLKQGATTRATFRYDEDTDTFSIQSGSDKWDFDTSGSSAVESGNTITIIFKFMPKWSAIQEDDLEIELYVIDAGTLTDTDVVQTNYVDVIVDWDTITMQEFQYSGTTKTTVKVRCVSEYFGNIINKAVRIRAYLNTTLWCTRDTVTDSEGFATITLDNLYQSGTLKFDVTDLTSNITSDQYQTSYSISASNLQITVDPLMYVTSGQTMTITLNYEPNAIVNETRVKLADIWFKANIYHTDGNPYGSQNFALHEGTVSSGIETRVETTGINIPDGAYYLICQLYIRGSDYLLLEGQSKTFSVVMAGAAAPSPAIEYKMTVRVLDAKNAPIKTAKVSIFDLWKTLKAEGITNIYGEFDQKLSKGSYFVEVTADSTVLKKEVELKEDTIVRFQFEFAVPMPTPVELFFETESVIFLLLGTLTIFCAMILERKGRTVPAILLSFTSIGLFIYGGALTFRLVKPAILFSEIKLPTFEMITLPQITLDALFTGDIITYIALILGSVMIIVPTVYLGYWLIKRREIGMKYHRAYRLEKVERPYRAKQPKPRSQLRSQLTIFLASVLPAGAIITVFLLVAVFEVPLFPTTWELTWELASPTGDIISDCVLIVTCCIITLLCGYAVYKIMQQREGKGWRV